MSFTFTFDPNYPDDATTFEENANSAAIINAAVTSTSASRRRLMTYKPLPVKLTTLGKAQALKEAVRDPCSLYCTLVIPPC